MNIELESIIKIKNSKLAPVHARGRTGIVKAIGMPQDKRMRKKYMVELESGGLIEVPSNFIVKE